MKVEKEGEGDDEHEMNRLEMIFQCFAQRLD
jgi:hypothetical protein